MTQSSHTGRLSILGAPPTAPAALPVQSRRGCLIVPIVLLAAAGMGLLFAGYWCYVISVNRQFTTGQTLWFSMDVGVRIVLWVALLVTAIVVLAGGRRGRTMLLLWSVTYLAWVPISAIGALSIGEPSPDVVFGVLFAVVGGPVVGFFGMIWAWLFLPAIAFVHLLFDRKRL